MINLQNVLQNQFEVNEFHGNFILNVGDLCFNRVFNTWTCISYLQMSSCWCFTNVRLDCGNEIRNQSPLRE